jgi:hypothetical protein
MAFEFKKFLLENKLTTSSKLRPLNEAEEDTKVIYNKLKSRIVSDEILDHDDLKAEPDYQKLSRSEQHKLHWVLTQAAEMHREGIQPEEDNLDQEPSAKDIKSTKGTADLAKKQNQLATLLKHKDELVGKFKSGELTIDQYKEKIGNVPQHIKTLTADIERLEAQAAGEGLNEEDTMQIGTNPSQFKKVKVGDKVLYGDEEVTITKIDRVKPGSGATQNRIIAQTADGETVTGKPGYFLPIA